MNRVAMIAAACAVAWGSAAPAQAAGNWLLEVTVTATGTELVQQYGFPDLFLDVTRTGSFLVNMPVDTFSGPGYQNDLSNHLSNPRALFLPGVPSGISGRFDLFTGKGTDFRTGGSTCRNQTSAPCRSYDFYAPTFSVTFVQSSGAAPPVPEPATWALMIAGFGAIGGAMRRRSYAARLRLHA